MENIRKIKITDIIANDNSTEGKRILAMNGISPARNREDLANKLNHLMRLNDGDILSQIADAHPDKDFILTFSSDSKSNATGDESKTLNKNGHGIGCRCPMCFTPYGAWGSSQELADDYMMGFDGSPVPVILNKKATNNSSEKSGLIDNVGFLGIGVIALSLVTVVALATRK